MKLDWYDKNDYTNAWKLASEDKGFKVRAQKAFLDLLDTGKDVFVDNTGLSVKRRKFYIENAKRHGYKTIGVVFPIDYETLIVRQKTRTDKTVPIGAVEHQYKILQQPSEGEFDEIVKSEQS